MLVTFWQGINYIIDCYAFYSNSAIAVNTFIRSIAGAVFPLFAPIMCKSSSTWLEKDLTANREGLQIIILVFGGRHHCWVLFAWCSYLRQFCSTSMVHG